MMITLLIIVFVLIRDIGNTPNRTAAAWDLFDTSVFLVVAAGVALAGACLPSFDAIWHKIMRC